MHVAEIYAVRDRLTWTTRHRVADEGLRGRIAARLALLFPEDVDPSDLPPPLVMHRISLALGLPVEVARPLACAACFYYAAADLADDLVDTPAGAPMDAETRLGVNDVCVLLFLFQREALAVPHPQAAAVAALLLDQGLVMASGQARDLLGTDAPAAADPVAIARDKTGGELGALFAAPALLSGLDPAPFLAFGRSLGTLLQVFTDYLDLFAKPASDDWRDAKPTLPIRHVLAHPALGARAALLLAGARRAVSRQQAARFLMIEAGTAARYRAFADEQLAAMAAAVEAAGAPAILAALHAETADLSYAVDDALAALAPSAEGALEGEVPPAFPSPDEEASAALASALVFLRQDAAGDECTEHHRWGLFGRPHVAASLFGQLVVAEHLRAVGQPHDAVAAAALGRRDPDGWRYYPRCGEIPPDADLTGLALQVMCTPSRAPAYAAAIDAAVRSLAANLAEDATIPTWLTVGTGLPGAPAAPLPWIGERCPASMANAVLGWHRARPGDPAVARCAARLAEWYDAPGPPVSAFYGPVVVDALGLIALTEVGLPAQSAVRGRIASRLAARRRLSGHFGTALETAFAATALALCGRLADAPAVRRALVDAQEADGGYPADPFYVTVGPHHEPGTYRSRLVTTAIAIRALRALGTPSP